MSETHSRPERARSAARPATALDIISLVVAILVPLVGLILGIVAAAQARAGGSMAHVLAKAAVVVSLTFIVAQVVILGVVIAAANQTAADARNAPFCAAIADHSALFGPNGPESLYEPMWTYDAGSSQEMNEHRERVWAENIDQIATWHQEVLAVLAAAPTSDTSGEMNYVIANLQEEAELLDPSTHPNGDGKSWYKVGVSLEATADWAAKHCHV